MIPQTSINMNKKLNMVSLLGKDEDSMPKLYKQYHKAEPLAC